MAGNDDIKRSICQKAYQTVVGVSNALWTFSQSLKGICHLLDVDLFVSAIEFTAGIKKQM
jgi:hypothetical protein